MIFSAAEEDILRDSCQSGYTDRRHPYRRVVTEGHSEQDEITALIVDTTSITAGLVVTDNDIADDGTAVDVVQATPITRFDR